MATLGEIIRTAREAKGLRQRDLASRVGVDERQIRRYERNEFTDLKVTRAKAIADALDLPLEQLIYHAAEGSGHARNAAETPANGVPKRQPGPTLASVDGAGPATGG